MVLKFIGFGFMKIFASNISKCIYLQPKCDTIATSLILTSDSLYNRMVFVKRRHEKAVCFMQTVFFVPSCRINNRRATHGEHKKSN